MSGTSIALLGPLEVRVHSTDVVISGSLLRLLLLRLAIEVPRPVSATALIDAVWGLDPPDEPANALQSLVSRLRRALSGGPAAGVDSSPGGVGGAGGAVTGGPGGYRLRLPDLSIDSEAFTRHAETGREQLSGGNADLAAATLRQALALWRGEALADAPDADWALSARRSLAARRTEALLDRLDADAALGRHALLAEELAALEFRYPVDERFAGRLVDALAAEGRTTDALAAYERFRVRVADALGTDPSPRLRARHLALLRGDGTTTPDRVDAAGSDARQGGPTRHNLPLTLTSFVGRDRDLDAVQRLLAAGRLVTIVGTGGCGKTRLATEVAASVGEAALPEVRLVQLAPVTSGDEIAAVVLSALGVHENRAADAARLRGTVDPAQRLVDALSDRRILLLLDNCEHLLGPAAELTERVLTTCPGVRVLTTSREPLGLTGEALWPLAPLALPPTVAEHAAGSAAAAVGVPAASPGAGSATAVSTMADYAAVRLFYDRARAVRPSFALDAGTVGDVVEIVRRLDGLPLAIELAAARLRTLPLPQITEGLSDRFRLLTGGSRTALPRHRTLRAVVEWSWDLLSDAERRVAEASSVFSAGVTAASAHAVCPQIGDEGDVADVLGSLVDKSLLILADDGIPRYRMLETLREFGIERLGAQGELAGAYDAHARFFAELAARAEPELRTEGQLPWIRALVAERENLGAAIRHLAASGDARAAVATAARLSWFWLTADWHADSHAGMSAAIEAADRVAGEHAGGAGARAADPIELSCLRGLSVVNAAALGVAGGHQTQESMRRELLQVLDAYEALVADARVLADWPRALASLVHLAVSAFARQHSGDPAIFERVFNDPIPWVAAMGHLLAAAFAENGGDLATLRVHAETGLAAARPLGERWALVGGLRLVAQARVYDGDLRGAADAYEEALTYSAQLAAEFGSANDDVFIRLQLARILQRLGDTDGALRQARHATAGPAPAPAGLRGIGTDALLLQIFTAAGRTVEAAEVRARITATLADRSAQPGPFGGHETALARSVAASIDLDEGRPDQAAAQLQVALEASIETTDRPLIAVVAIGVGRLARSRGDNVLAARLVGAAGFLRGSPDESDLEVADLLETLRADLGAAEVARLTGFDGDRDQAFALLRAAVEPPRDR